jgi:hypothetical protein
MAKSRKRQNVLEKMILMGCVLLIITVVLLCNMCDMNDVLKNHRLLKILELQMYAQIFSGVFHRQGRIRGTGENRP